MAKKKEAPLAGAVLHRRAEAQLAAVQGAASETVEEPLKLLHELQVHQLELETQNAELQQARDETASLLEQYTDLYDFAPVGYFTVERRGTIRSSNLTGAGLLGVERCRLNGRYFRQFLTEEDRPAFATFLNQIFLNPAKATCEAALLAKEHSPRSVQIEAVAAASGEYCHLAVIDITRRILAEEELRESGERHRLLAETMLHGVVHQDATGRIVAMNPAAERILGKSHEDFLGSSSVQEEHLTIRENGECFPGTEHPSMVALRTGLPVRGVIMGVFNPQLDAYRWVSVDAVPVFHQNRNRPSEVYTVFEDITEQKQNQEVIRVSEKRYRALFQSLLHGFAYCQVLQDDQEHPIDFIFLEVNNAFGRLTGKPDVIGKRITEVFPGIRDAHPELFVTLGRVAQSGQPESFDLEYKPLDMWLTLAVYSVEPGYFSVTFGDISLRKRLEQELQRNVRDISALKQHIEAENIYLRAEIRDRLEPGELIGTSNALRTVLAQAEQLAQSNITVLLQGETGTGKELLARYIHQHSNRSRRSLYKLSCAAIPTTLLESELFGHEKGAFTGAINQRIGHFELADQATIFLDEVGEFSLEAQAKLLRVLQEGEFCRVGSAKTLKTNVRVIAATNQNLSEEVRQGRFREDLYYRLSAFPLTVPTLRERPEDIPLMVWAFVHELGTQMGKTITRISAQDMTALQQYFWPGNVRELRNVIEYSVIFSRDETLQLRLPATLQPVNRTSLTLQDMEYQHISDVLRSTNWRVAGPKGAARVLGLHPNTLHFRMKKLGITPLDKIYNIR